MAAEPASMGVCARFLQWSGGLLGSCGGGDVEVTCANICNYMTCLSSFNCCGGDVTVHGNYTETGNDTTTIHDGPSDVDASGILGGGAGADVKVKEASSRNRQVAQDAAQQAFVKMQPVGSSSSLNKARTVEQIGSSRSAEDGSLKGRAGSLTSESSGASYVSAQ